MGYKRRDYAIGERPYQPDSPVVVTMGSNWKEDHYVTLPPSGGVTMGTAVDKVILHVRNRVEDEEPLLEATTDPAQYLTVARPSPDKLHIQLNVPAAITATLFLSAPDSGRVPGTPTPPEPVPGTGIEGMEVVLTNGEVYEIFRSVIVTQAEYVF